MAVITTTRLEFDVPEYDQGDGNVLFGYSVHLGTKAEGNTHFMVHNGEHYVTTRHHDTTTARDGWPESPYQAHTLLYERLWNDVLVQALSLEQAPVNLHELETALTVGTAPERRDAWDELRSYSSGFRPTTETEDDIEYAARRAADIIEGLISYGRELLIRTGQPCYRVVVKGEKASVSVSTTDVHRRMREADFTHPVLYPGPHMIKVNREEREAHYFSGLDHEGIASFLDGIGVRAPARLPKFYRFEYSDHREDFDGLELDRVARAVVYETAGMVNLQSAFALPVHLLRGRRALYDKFFDLRGFLEARHDPEEAGERLWGVLDAFGQQWTADPGHSILHGSTCAFLTRALQRFADRPVGVELAPPTGILPKSP